MTARRKVRRKPRNHDDQAQDKSAREIILALGGVWRMRSGRAPCPAHGGTDDNLQIWSKVDAPHGIIVKCWSGNCNTKEIFAALADKKLISGKHSKPRDIDPAELAREIEEARRDREKQYQRAVRTWQRAEPGQQSREIANYLAARGIDLSRLGEIPECLRYSTECFHGLTKTFHPAMIAAITDATGQMTAIYQTFLNFSGSAKARLAKPKLALGSCDGGAVRLFPLAEEMGLSEGIETALSAHELTGLPTWAALGTSGMINFMVPPAVRRVVIFADFDPVIPKLGYRPGSDAAETLAARLKQQCIECQVRFPAGGLNDFCDELNARKATAA